MCAPLPTTPYKVFANIPFNATAAIVTTLTTAPHPADDIYLAIQKEAAGKYCGQPRESMYAVLLKPWFEPEIVHRFQRTDFVPAPNVDVVMLRLRKRGPPLVSRHDAQLFRDFVTHAFTAWQPCLRDTLIPISAHRQLIRAYQHAALSPDATPTIVRFEQWLTLFHHLKDSPCIQAVAGAARRLKAQQAGLHKIHRTRREHATIRP